MARITLKITKPADPAALPKAPTSRARRAQEGKRRLTAPVAAPKPQASAVAAAAAPAAPARRKRTRGKSGAPAVSGERARPHAPAARGENAASTAANPSKPASMRPGSRRRDVPGAAPKGALNRDKPAYTPRGTPKFGAHAKPATGDAATRPATGDAVTRFARGERPTAKYGAKPSSRPSSSRPPARPHATGKHAHTAPRHENPDDPRLSKRMSELGLCSRREADEWIENGWVRVDGHVITTLGVRVSPHARIDIDPAAAHHQSEQVTILLNKPIGYVSGQAEDGHVPAMALIKPENRWPDDPSPMKFKPGHLRGLAPAGRLDIDSTGLLVFTQDGRLAKHLIGRDSAVEKEYLVRVEGRLPDNGMKLLQHGLELDGVKLKPARVSWQNEDQLRVVLREGRKRQIRRMCELVGLVVTGLKRVRSGGVPLGPLPVGQWRYLRRDEKF